MVSFWPWKGVDNSPASFEKILSTLSGKISKTTNKLDGLRQRSRRLSVLFTLYAGFAYLLYTIILVLVVGWRKWGPAEYSAVAAGPVIIYLVRLGLSTYYNHRTSSVQGQLDDLQKQRDTTIEKLKAATKYDSTQELLKKYGGTPSPKEKPGKFTDRKESPKREGLGTPKIARTGVAPPPTANIPGRDGSASTQITPQRASPQTRSLLGQHTPHTGAMTSTSQRPLSPQEEFAPNAFSAAPQYALAIEGSRWYDRIMDVLLGEDETRPGARIALICSNCRLVNGQAPPGIMRLEALGRWRCGGCGTMNGEETEAKKILASIREQASTDARYDEKEREDSPVSEDSTKGQKPALPSAGADGESDITQYSDASSDKQSELREIEKNAVEAVDDSDTPRRRSTRSKRGGRKAG